MIEKPVRTIDIMPTLLDLLRIKTPEQAEGKSLIGFLSGNKDMKHTKTVYSEQGGGFSETIILDNKWKLILNYDTGLDRPPKQLYNLDKDPDEAENLVFSLPAVEAELFELMGNEKVKWKQYETPDTYFPDWIDEKTKKRLIEEGYF